MLHQCKLWYMDHHPLMHSIDYHRFQHHRLQQMCSQMRNMEGKKYCMYRLQLQCKCHCHMLEMITPNFLQQLWVQL